MQISKISISRLYYTYRVFGNLAKSNQKPKAKFYAVDGRLEQASYNVVINGRVETRIESKLKDTAGPTDAYLGWLRLKNFVDNYCRYINAIVDRYNAGEDLEKFEQQAIINYACNWNKMLEENGLEYVK